MNKNKHKTSPSFSSLVLDEMYRSMDKNHEPAEPLSKNNKNIRPTTINIKEKRTSNINQKNYWSSSSSESSSGGGGFSSSETESFFMDQRLRPVRTGSLVQNKVLEPERDQQLIIKGKNGYENYGFGKTKAKAMKIYGDLKKVKQPISPGGRLATFLNSLFTSTTPKKAKTSSSTRTSFDKTISQNNPKSKRASFDETILQNPKPKPSCTSTCSSASSFSRSCLSNSSSREKTDNEAKRSVRFYPVNVVLGEDSCPKYKNEARNMISNEIKIHIMEKNRRVEEAARDLLKKYQHVEYEYFNARDARKQDGEKFNFVDNVDDDAASCASSDLFELDHLSAIEELPVYETTHLRTNFAIANGLIS